MAGPGKKLTDKAKALVSKYFEPDSVGEKAGIDFLNRAGFLKWRLEQLGLLQADSYVMMDENYTRSTLPWLDIAGDTDHFERYDALQSIFNVYIRLVRVLNIQRREEMTKRNEDIMYANLKKKQAGQDLLPYFELKDFSHLSLDPELEEFKNLLETYLQWGSRILQGLSFDDPDDNVSLIVSKPIIMQEGRTRIIKAGGGVDDPKEVNPDAKF